jgi:hypothetical protein
MQAERPVQIKAQLHPPGVVPQQHAPGEMGMKQVFKLCKLTDAVKIPTTFKDYSTYKIKPMQSDQV